MPSEEYEYETFDESIDYESVSNATLTTHNNSKHKHISPLLVGVDDYGINIFIHPSKGQGTYIIDGATGLKTPHKVGSRYEDLYFSVIDARGSLKLDYPLTYFFNSPEQYEKLMQGKVCISTETKNKWHKRQLKYRKLKPANDINVVYTVVK